MIWKGAIWKPKWGFVKPVIRTRSVVIAPRRKSSAPMKISSEDSRGDVCLEKVMKVRILGGSKLAWCFFKGGRSDGSKALEGC